MICRECSQGSIAANGICNHCGFDEGSFVNEWLDWQVSLMEPVFLAEWEEWKVEVHAA